MGRSRGQSIKVQAVAELLHEKAKRLYAQLGFLSPEFGELLKVTEILRETVRESDKAGALPRLQ